MKAAERRPAPMPAGTLKTENEEEMRRRKKKEMWSKREREGGGGHEERERRRGRSRRLSQRGDKDLSTSGLFITNLSLRERERD